MTELTEKMTFKSYFEYLSETAKTFKEKVIDECGISEPTFYRYLSNPEQMPKLVREKIQEIVTEVEILFPEA